ncbi:CarD family transcriptional regulator [bacterium]|nr:CarD family transcriptional regulator [candidate division CSSED10-310 bacterium]
MFSVGDLLIYPTQGLAEVQGIEKKMIGDSAVDFYILRIVAKSLAIMVPTANEQKIGLRKIVGRDQLEKVWDILSRPSETHYSQWHHRYTDNYEKLKSGSILSTAEVLRDLYLLKQKKNLAIKESRMMDNAMQLLITEIAAAEGVTDKDAGTRVRDSLKKLSPKN